MFREVVEREEGEGGGAWADEGGGGDRRTDIDCDKAGRCDRED